MTPIELIQNLKLELSNREELYLKNEVETEVSSLIASMKLDHSQNKKMEKIIHLLIQETAYGLICGFEGSASIGNFQETFKIFTNSEVELTGDLDNLFYDEIIGAEDK